MFEYGGVGADNIPGVNFFINTIIQLFTPLLKVFTPLNAFVTAFPIQTYRSPNLTLPKNRSKSTQGHN